ncbi:acetyl-CoA C-acyltransferase [Brevundimonas sp.]|uniref:acetyl-CoA C-acyltransferase n=1 Tax=Brevundimonas sp. TaxID=1871086 RepID=UPI002FCA2C31
MSAYIHDALRTPRGKARPNGGLAGMKPQQLVGGLIDALEARGHAPRKADGLLLGCVGQVGAQGGNIALVSKLYAGLDDAAFAYTLNNYCVSGLTAIGQAAQMVSSGAASSLLAGGVEMMSHVPFMADKADYYTDADLEPRARFLLVALAADRLAEDSGITRHELDAVTLTSQQRTAAAEDSALVASRIAVNALTKDEAARASTRAESLAAMPAAFATMAPHYAGALDGREIAYSHTLAHAPPMTDGAALALVSADPKGARARIVASVEIGGDPYASLTAGFDAMERVLIKAGLTLADMDRIEFMEAFAVVIAKFLRDYDVDPDRVNVGGGHLAKGHPMGATGAILLSSLLDALDASKGRFGMVVATGAQGIGSAMIVERMDAQA